MKIIVHLNGHTYVSKKIELENSNINNVEDYSNYLYETIPDLAKFRMLLEDGGFLILGTNAIQSASIILTE